MHTRIAYILRAFGLSALLVLPLSTALADRGVDYVSMEFPLIEAIAVSEPPVLDGVLDDAAWSQAAEFSDFYVAELDKVPTERTVVWLAYDDSSVYIAARCYDRSPGTLRMEQTRRGGEVQNDDYIAFGIDLHNQHKRGSDHVFRVTPRGVQDETIPEGSAAKVEWRGDWLAAAAIDSLGWTVEAAIPLAMFNQAPGPHTVGFSVYRWHPRTQEAIRWPNLGNNWDRTRAGDWVGVNWPEQRRRPRIMPYVVGESDDGKPDGYMGVDMKHTTASGFTYVGTLYPDFQNVENDILGLDFSYTELIRDDNRPFFREGTGFLPEDWIFYSNRVGEVYGGAKVFGQVGTHGFGLVEAYDRDNVNHMAGQWEWTPADRLQMETKFSWRSGPADAVDPGDGPPVENNLLVVNEIIAGRLVGRGTEEYRIQSGLTQSSGDSADGWNLETSWMRNAGNGEIGWSLRARLLSEGFTVIDGAYDEVESDQRDLDTDLWYEIEFDRTWFRTFGIENDARYSTRFNGDLYVRENALEVWVEVLPGSGIWAKGEDEERPPYHDRTGELGLWWNEDHLYTTGETGVEYGRRKGGDLLFLWFEQGVRPLPMLNTSLRTQWRRHDLPVGHEDRPQGGSGEPLPVYRVGAVRNYYRTGDLWTNHPLSGWHERLPDVPAGRSPRHGPVPDRRGPERRQMDQPRCAQGDGRSRWVRSGSSAVQVHLRFCSRLRHMLWPSPWTFRAFPRFVRMPLPGSTGFWTNPCGSPPRPSTTSTISSLTAHRPFVRWSAWCTTIATSTSPLGATTSVRT